MITGCFHLNAGASAQKSWVDRDGTSHEKHAKWNISDPFTALGETVHVSFNVFAQPDGCYGNNQEQYGRFYDPVYRRWCLNGYHFEEHSGQTWSVPNR